MIIRYKDLVLLPLVGKMLKDCFTFGGRRKAVRDRLALQHRNDREGGLGDVREPVSTKLWVKT